MTDQALVTKARSLGLHEAAAMFQSGRGILHGPHNRQYRPKVSKEALKRLVAEAREGQDHKHSLARKESTRSLASINPIDMLFRALVGGMKVRRIP